MDVQAGKRLTDFKLQNNPITKQVIYKGDTVISRNQWMVPAALLCPMGPKGNISHLLLPLSDVATYLVQYNSENPGL